MVTPKDNSFVQTSLEGIEIKMPDGRIINRETEEEYNKIREEQQKKEELSRQIYIAKRRQK